MKLPLIFTSILISIYPVPFSLIIEPVTFIDVPIGVNESPLPIGLVGLEPALVDAAVHKALYSETLPHTLIALGAWVSPERCPLTLIV
jgi:hypothetical protein